MSVAVLAVPTGGVTVAVFVNVPVAARADRAGDRVGDRAAGGQVDAGVVDIARAAGCKAGGGGRCRCGGGPRVAGEVGGERIGDRGPGDAARAGLLTTTV